MEIVLIASIVFFGLNFRWAVVAQRRHKNPILPSFVAGICITIAACIVSQLLS